MDAIVLEPGRPPRLRRGGAERELSTPPLDGRVIGRLMQEVMPAGAFPGPSPAGGVRILELRNAVDGVDFLLSAVEVNGAWRLEAKPQRNGAGATASDQEPPKPGSSTQPVPQQTAQPDAPEPPPPASQP